MAKHTPSGQGGGSRAWHASTGVSAQSCIVYKAGTGNCAHVLLVYRPAAGSEMLTLYSDGSHSRAGARSVHVSPGAGVKGACTLRFAPGHMNPRGATQPAQLPSHCSPLSTTPLPHSTCPVVGRG